MLLDIYQDIWKEITRKKINIDKTYEEHFMQYIKGKALLSYIYPSNLCERFNLERKEAIKILIILKSYGILEQVYKLYCPDCDEYQQEVYTDIEEIGFDELCMRCGKELVSIEDPLKYVEIYYRVIKNA